MKREINYLVIGIVVGLIIGCICGYLYTRSSVRSNFPNRGSFQIDENTQNEIISFFESTSDINQIKDYCNNNIQNCVYYCRNINQNHEICASISNSSRRPGGIPK